MEEHDAISYLEGYQDGEKAGIKKVVDWFMKHNKSVWGGFSSDIDALELEAQLKSWGIKGD